jgi:type II secretory pathway component GspD/PulD (secretin)
MKYKKFFPKILIAVVLMALLSPSTYAELKYLGTITCFNGNSTVKYTIFEEKQEVGVVQNSKGVCTVDSTFGIDLEVPIDIFDFFKVLSKITNMQFIIDPTILRKGGGAGKSVKLGIPLYFKLENVSLDDIISYTKKFLSVKGLSYIEIARPRKNLLMIIPKALYRSLTYTQMQEKQIKKASLRKKKTCENPVYLNYADLCLEGQCKRYIIYVNPYKGYKGFDIYPAWICKNGTKAPIIVKNTCSNSTPVINLSLSEVPLPTFVYIVEQLFNVNFVFNPDDIAQWKGKALNVKASFHCFTLSDALDFLRNTYHLYIEKINEYTYRIYKDRNDFFVVLNKVSNYQTKVYYLKGISPAEFTKLLTLYYGGKVIYSVDNLFSAVTVIAPAAIQKDIVKKFGIYFREYRSSDRLMAKIFYLKYGKPENIIDEIKQYMSEKGKVHIVQEGQGIEVIDYPTNIAMIEKVFGKFLSQKPIKIKITAKFVSISKDFARSLGFNWDATYNGEPLQDRGISSIAMTKNTDGLTINAQLLWKKVNPLNFIISAGETLSLAKTLSSPSLILLNNQPGTISSGTQIPYQSVDENGNPKTELVAATLTLSVQPELLPDGRILLRLNLSKNEPNTALAVNGQPAINTFTIAQNIIVNDGETVVIGGVLEKTDQKGENGVPLLKEIPLLGWLFKNTNLQRSEKELMIFITAKVVNE